MPLSEEEARSLGAVLRNGYRLERENEQLRARLVKARARLAKLQEPEGHRAERVAEWLRERGYKVEKHDPE